MADRQKIARVARRKFGYETLRPGQEEAIAAVLDGRDTLAVMPTGWGKSAIYQVAAVLVPGATVVVSPLIALQRDQLEAIGQQEIAQAAAVNSLVAAGQQREAWEGFEEGHLEFLFLAPEQFSRPETIERVKAARPSLFVVDEAHCISKWGHNFRPDYLKLGAVIEELGHPTVLALTATAAAGVRDEIIEKLRLREPVILLQSFDRPNIRLEVVPCADERAKQKALVARLRQAERPGIVYVATRRHAEEVGALLAELGEDTLIYHAGLTKGEREAAQAAFMADDARVIVATNAFGMGIDKPNVRFVYHYDVSGSLDAYYQEIGRAGRDGQPAEAVLFYRRGDLGLQRFFASSGKVEPDQVEQVIAALPQRDEPASPGQLSAELGLSSGKVTAAVHGLEAVGAVEVQATGTVAAAEAPLPAEEAARHAAQGQEDFRQAERARVDLMQAYAETEACRRQYVLNYFGEALEPPCKNCDNCLRSPRAAVSTGVAAISGDSKPFPLKSWVRHKGLGKGMVARYDRNKITILFDEEGYKTFALDVVLQQNLLEPLTA